MELVLGKLKCIKTKGKHGGVFESALTGEQGSFSDISLSQMKDSLGH